MVTLEDRQADSIDPTDIAALVGREENQKLEYKETIEKIDVHELAKDLASFANAAGGYIVVGAVQSKHTEKCTGFRSVSSVDGTLKKIRHVGATHIDERLALEPIVRDAPSGERLVLVQIPRSPKLRAVITHGKAEYWKRFGTDKREMTHREIEDAIASGQAAAVEEEKRQRSLVDHPTRWNEITSSKILCEVMDKRFQERIGDQRYLRMTSAPLDLRAARVDTSDLNFRAFLQFPSFGQRQTGWYLGIGQGLRQLVPTPLGLESQPTANDYEAPPPSLVLTRSGHFEFWVPLFAWVCFQQNREQFQAQPRLWPIAVVEFPLNFLLFVKELYRRIGVTGAITVRIEYQNLGGCILYPGGPAGGLWHSGPFTFSEQHYGPYEQHLAVDFDPEAAALAFALHLYQAFGYDRTHIPCFPNDKFTPGMY